MKALWLFAVLATASFAQAGNLLENPSFELEGKAWTPAATAAQQILPRWETTMGRTGGKCVCVEGLQPVSYGEWRVDPDPVLKPGEKYFLSVWVKQEQVKEAAPYWDVYSFDAQEKPTHIGYEAGIKGTQDWYQIHGTFTVPADSKHCRVGLGLSTSTGKVWFDDAYLGLGDAEVEAAPPATDRKGPPAQRESSEGTGDALKRAQTWTAMPQGVRQESVPRVLEGAGAATVEVGQAASYSAKQEDGRARFEVAGDAPEERTMMWSRALPAGAEPAAGYVLRYRAEGIRRSFAEFAAVKVSGRDPNGAQVSLPLLDCSQVINDGLPHVLTGKLPKRLVPAALQVELSTTSDRATLDLDSVEFTPAVPEPDSVVLSTPGASGVTRPAGDGAFVEVDLSAAFNDTCAAAFRRLTDTYGLVQDGCAQLKPGRLMAYGVPFSIGDEAKNLIRPAEDYSPNEKTVEFLGAQVPRKYLMPIGRKDVTEIPIGRNASELFFILLTEAPPVVSPYSRPKLPFQIQDVEAVAIELVYADGGSEFAFPFSLADDGFIIRRMAGVYAVPADAKRTLKAVRLFNRTWGVTVDVAAVTVNTSAARAVARLAVEPPAVHVPSLPEPAARAPYVRQDGSRIVFGNRFCELTLDTAAGFSIAGLSNGYAPATAIALDPVSGIEIRAGNRKMTGHDFAVEAVKVNGLTATFTLRSKVAEVPLTADLTISVNDTPQFAFGGSLTNSGAAPLASLVKFPALRGLRIGALEDNWIYFPEFLNVQSNAYGYHVATNDRAFPLQFCDAYNPSAGIGFALITHNLNGRPLDYCMGKDERGVNVAIQYPVAYHTLAPGGSLQLTETCLAAHNGDWHQALALYKDWVATWFKPHYATDRGWFDRVFLLRGEGLAAKGSWEIWKTPPMYTGTPDKFLLDEVLKADEEQWGCPPDLIHLSDWFYTADDEGGSWGDYDYTQLAVGGLDSFRTLIDDIQKTHKIPLSLYTIPDRVSRKTRAGERFGKDACRYGPDGKPADPDWVAWPICPEYKPWRDYFVATVKRIQSDTGARAMYLDVFPFFRGGDCYRPDHGHDVPTWCGRAALELLTQLRAALPPNVPLWSEEQVSDVCTQYFDGSIAYYELSLAGMFSEPYDTAERAPLFSDPMRNVYQFAFPHMKQFCFPVGIEHDYNGGRVRFIFFNGDTLEDCTWRLFDERARALIGNGIRVEHQFADCFATRRPEMLVPTEAGQVYANKFPGEGRTVWTIYNARFTAVHGPVLAIDHREGAAYYDAWNNKPLTPQIINGKAVISLTLDPQGLGCVVQTIAPAAAGK